VPPDGIQWRAMLGSGTERIEPTAEQRMASVFLLDPSRPHRWKGTWSNRFRFVVRDGRDGLAAGRHRRHGAVSQQPPRTRRPSRRAHRAQRQRIGFHSGGDLPDVWPGPTLRPASLGSALLQRQVGD